MRLRLCEAMVGKRGVALGAFRDGGSGPKIMVGLLAALAFCVFPVSPANASVIPVFSEIAPSANAQINDVGPEVFMQPTASQSGTLNPLSLSVDNAVVFPQGAPLLVGAACNPTAANFCVSVDGQETATWTSASHGTVTFSNYGWHDHLSLTSAPPTAGASNLGPMAPTEQFLYSFVAGPAGTMDIHYTVTNSGSNCFGLMPFDIDASGGSGGPFGSVGLSSTCGTVSGDLTGPITAGASYNFFIKNQSNVSGGLLDRTALIDATFDYTIPDSSTVPEPPSFLLMGSMIPGISGYVWSRRRR